MTNTYRTFIAIKIQPRPKLIALIDHLKKKLEGEKIKWVETSNLHLTLKFLGDTRTDEIENVKLCLQRVSAENAKLQFDLAGLGCFKNKGNPRVLFSGIRNAVNLKKLAASIETEIANYGFEREIRNFKPHLTLGRIKFLKDKPGFYKVVNEYKNIGIQTVGVSEIIYYKSVLLPFGSVYEPINIFKL